MKLNKEDIKSMYVPVYHDQKCDINSEGYEHITSNVSEHITGSSYSQLEDPVWFSVWYKVWDMFTLL